MSKRKRKESRTNLHAAYSFTLVFFIIYNLFLTAYSIFVKNYYAIKGQSTFIVLATALYYYRRKLKIGPIAFFFILTSFAIHTSHVLGNLYQSTSLLIPWDYLSHGTFFIGATIYFFGLRKKNINLKRKFCFKNWFLFLTLFLTISGLGVLIELGEYSGYMILGNENGAKIFGGGDYEGIIITNEVISDIEFHGGGWFDAMSDLLINSIATIATLLVLFFWYFHKPSA